MIWIWMGDPRRADSSAIPDFSVIPEVPSGAGNLGNYPHVKANYLLEIDNPMDLTHVNFLHNGTLGNESMRGHRVRVTARGLGWCARICSCRIRSLNSARSQGSYAISGTI
jgi:phenylpropionate dioxygenase-like ring-hydroxylating dioxygenase large terminal subunit